MTGTNASNPGSKRPEPDNDNLADETGCGPDDDAAGENSGSGTGDRPESEASKAEAVENTVETVSEPRTPEEKIAVLEAERDELKDRLLRALAETENVRRRAEKDVREATRYSVAKFAQDMVSVADNLGRALDSLSDDLKDDERLKGFVEGVELTGRELAAAFEKHGIREVHPEGEKFDHNLHEAMFEVEDPDQPHGTVAHVLESGYTIHDRLLRPAKVGVTKKPG